MSSFKKGEIDIIHRPQLDGSIQVIGRITVEEKIIVPPTTSVGHIHAVQKVLEANLLARIEAIAARNPSVVNPP